MARPDATEITTNLVERINSIERRIRQLEENVRNLRDQFKNIENDVIRGSKEAHEVRDLLDDKTGQMRTTLLNLDVEVKNINNRIRTLVSKREIKELESFMEIFSPIKNMYVTRNEVQRMIEEAITKTNESYQGV